jgi:predicted ABC-type transport system involved in lysophospholipase L1 biosynthesis ATPase subunit
MTMELNLPRLSARDLRKDYGRGAALIRAVDDISLDVTQGESVAIVGPSGCGKSTLLYLLGGLERPTAGTLRVAGGQLEQTAEAGLAKLRRHAIGFVFQAFHLVDELTALENVELPALLAGASPRHARDRALELLEVGRRSATSRIEERWPKTSRPRMSAQQDPAAAGRGRERSGAARATTADTRIHTVRARPRCARFAGSE